MVIVVSTTKIDPGNDGSKMRYHIENENRELENKILYVKSDFYEK